MTTKQRILIQVEAKKLIISLVPNYKNLSGGEKEVIQDKYIKQVCIKNNQNVSDFYAENGKKLNNLFNMM